MESPIRVKSGSLIKVNSPPAAPTPESIEIFTNKDKLILNHQLNLYNNGYLSRKCSSTAECCLSDVELTSEYRVNIETLTKNINTILEGNYFLCRCITSPNKISSVVETIVEDPEGVKAVRIALYNFSCSTKQSNLEDVLPVGIILAIKNPMFKHSSSDELILRCKNPDEIEILSLKRVAQLFPDLKWKGKLSKEFKTKDIWGTWECDKFVSPAPEFIILSKLQRLGNKAIVDMRFLDAVRWYTLGLEYSQNHTDMLINRGSAFYNLMCYNKALKDVDSVLEIYPFNIKAIYRKVKCLLSLKYYEEAVSFLDTKFLKIHELEDDQELYKLKNTAKILLLESNQKEFNMARFLTKKYNSKTMIEAVEFTGPVKVQKIPGKGRGICVTEVIKPGQLLIASKAFALHKLRKSTSSINIDPPRRVLQRTNIHSSQALDPSILDQQELVGLISYKLTVEPELGPELYNLYAGPVFESLDTDSILNQKVDIKRIQQIVRFNSFTFGNQQANSFWVPHSSHSTSSSEGCGIWLLPSMINHSCSEANCYWTVVGDLMLIRAVQPIRRGDEITISYICPTFTLRERQYFFRPMGFTCTCTLCQIELAESKEVRHRRKEIMKSLKEALEMLPLMSSSGFIQAMNDISEIESIRKKYPKLNLPMISAPVRKLADGILDKGNLPSCIELLERIHSISQDIAFSSIVTVSLSLTIVKHYLAIRKVKMVEKWVKCLRHDLVIAFGSSELLKTLSPRILEELNDLQVNEALD